MPWYGWFLTGFAAGVIAVSLAVFFVIGASLVSLSEDTPGG